MFLQLKPICPCDGGCPRCAPVIQPKLIIGQPNDKYEQEADRVADQVIRMPEPDVQPKPTWPLSQGPSCRDEDMEGELIQTRPIAEKITPLVQRQPEEEELVQPKENSSASEKVSLGIENSIDSLRGGGQALPKSTRAFFESRFGSDFRQVRVHTNRSAAEMAMFLNAYAFTSGPNIVFGAGQYAPGTPEGQRLLAHELIHVIQQSTHGVQGNRECFVQRYPSSTPHGRPYTPGVMHNHRPSGRWADIQNLERRNCPGTLISCVCSTLDPQGVLNTAAGVVMGRKPIALHHLLHYMFGGGADYVEDVRDFIVRDSGVRGILASFIRNLTTTRGHFKVYQRDYTVQDFRLAFGAIDRLDYEVDSAAGVVHVWFVDRYEFHPVYPGLYRAMSGDVARVTNCVHAAAVELKASGASDFWMVGYGTVPLSTVTGSAPSGGGTIL